MGSGATWISMTDFGKSGRTKLMSDTDSQSTSDSKSPFISMSPLHIVSAIKSRISHVPLEDDEESNKRVVRVNSPAYNAKFDYTNNYVRTAKYTLLTFIPRNLFEQFGRVANCWFLLISLLQMFSGVSPTGKYNTLQGLVFVLFCTAVKEAWEDYKRHKQDKELNGRPTRILRVGWSEFRTVRWEEVVPGDFVRLNDGEFLPCDLVCLSSSDAEGCAFVETAGLDGETNLKIRQVVEQTQHMKTPDEFLAMTGEIACEGPNNKLYKFDGTLTDGGSVTPLTLNNVMLRGCVLKNTKWMVGLAVYTGHDTKLMKNATEAPSKRSRLEREANHQIVTMFLLNFVLCVISVIGTRVWKGANEDDHWYLLAEGDERSGIIFDYIVFLILYNNMIPISLYVSMEIVKLVQAYLINVDLAMYHEETDTPAMARTSNLNEELGQVDYVFSDKTGTLTCNIMEFRRCVIGSRVYGEPLAVPDLLREDDSDPDTGSSPVPIEENYSSLDLLRERVCSSEPGWEREKEFILHLSLCHTVIPEDDPKEPQGIRFQAASPDEAALVAAARDAGILFHKRTTHTVSVKVPWEGNRERVYEVLAVCEFTSSRKRMSIVLRRENGDIELLCKGADTVIFERLRDGQEDLRHLTSKQLEEFGKEGLRTLVIGKSALDKEEFEKWYAEFEKASTALVGREEKLAAAAAKVEKDLTLVGATAIEDRLQDGVPETISTLAKAGVNVWVLTGDKQETAINIGFSCCLLTDKQELLIMNEPTLEGTRSVLKENLEIAAAFESRKAKPDVESGRLSLRGSRSRRDSVPDEECLALVIDGATLEYALKEELEEDFVLLATQCKAVVCCRVSPLQKALVVKLVQRHVSAITLAIGDGANDVSMIQAAHVGVGISGQEGMQAVRSSDYAIAQFRFLGRLMLVHGQWAYKRIAKLIVYSFYKNLVFVTPLFLFTFFSAHGGTSLYEQYSMAFFNMIFSALPIIFFSILNQDISATVAVRHPEVYTLCREGHFFNRRVFWQWMANASLHAIIILFCTVAIYGDYIAGDGTSGGFWVMGTAVYTFVLSVISYKILLESTYLTWFNLIVIWGSWLLWFIFMFAYENIIAIAPAMYKIWSYMLGGGVFWFSLLLVPLVFCLLRDYVWKYYIRTTNPTEIHTLQLKVHECRKRGRPSRLMSFTEDQLVTHRSNRSSVAYTGYAFAGEDALGRTVSQPSVSAGRASPRT
eukprot:Rmarinus@m.20920